MTIKNKIAAALDFMLSLGVSGSDDIQRVRQIRQLNGLNLFYTFIAGSVSIIFFVFMKSAMLLGLIQAFATLLYITNLIITSRKQIQLAQNMTIYIFEFHMFSIMLLTNAWHSPALSLIILYPLLGALLEVSIYKHLFMGIGQAAVLYSIYKFFPGLESALIYAGNITSEAVEVLNLMGGTYTPTMAAVIMSIIYSENLRARKKQKDMLIEISAANRQLGLYADQLKDETQKLKAEINIAKKIQTMVLPSAEEISGVEDLDISCIMRTATEVGGDYYDILKLDNKVLIGIGDVTGHGLSSGLVMLMAQTAIRTLAEFKKTSPSEYLEVLNRVLYANVTRIKEDRSMTLMLLTYENNRFIFSGQHESIVICRKNGDIEVTDTASSGFYVGMTPDPPVSFTTSSIRLEKDDVLFLYTDGVTEAENEARRQFGLEKLCETLKKYHNLPAEKIRDKFMKDLYNYMGETEIYDDISLVVIKQK